MTDYMNAPLSELVKDIVADGVVDADEVKGIRARIYADGVIDKEEADFLFEINDAVSGKANDAGWKDLFVEAISKYVLEDEVSPNVIDDDEADYLVQKIQGDGQVDDVEKALIDNIRAKAISVSPKLTL